MKSAIIHCVCPLSALVMLPMAMLTKENTEINKNILSLSLKENNEDVLWISFGMVDCETVSIIVALLIFIVLVRYIIGEKKR